MAEFIVGQIDYSILTAKASVRDTAKQPRMTAGERHDGART